MAVARPNVRNVAAKLSAPNDANIQIHANHTNKHYCSSAARTYLSVIPDLIGNPDQRPSPGLEHGNC